MRCRVHTCTTLCCVAGSCWRKGLRKTEPLPSLAETTIIAELCTPLLLRHLRNQRGVCAVHMHGRTFTYPREPQGYYNILEVIIFRPPLYPRV